MNGNKTHGRNGTEADHVAPAVSDVLERQVQAVRDDLASRDGNNIKGNEASTESSRRELADVERNDEGGETDAKTDDEAANGHDPV